MPTAVFSKFWMQLQQKCRVRIERPNLLPSSSSQHGGPINNVHAGRAKGLASSMRA